MEMVRLACFTLIGAFASGQSVAQLQIAGRAINTSGQPVAKATIELIRVSPRLTTSTSTGEDGRFIIGDLTAGQYSVTAQRAGYAPYRLTASVWLSNGQSKKNLEFKFTPQAIITGRVSDLDGDPVANAVVDASHITYSRKGTQIEFGGTFRTDELGNFRIAGLAPGAYYLSASFRRPGAQFSTITFFPNSPDRAGASKVIVTAGAELNGLNIVLRKGDGRFSIRGKVMDMKTGEPITAQALTLAYRDGRGRGGPDGFAKADGSFEIRNVPPGTVLVETLLSSTNWSNMGQVEVTVRDADVEGVVLRVTPAMLAHGTVRLASGGPATPGPFVRLVPVDVPFNGSDPSGQASPDGSFDLRQIAPVRYLLETHELPVGTYIQSIRMGDRDAMHGPLDFSSGVDGDLKIVLAPHAAGVSGTAKPNAIVAVWSKEHSDEGQTAVADDSGEFHFSNLAPGEYRILAWEGIDPGLAEYSPYRERFNALAGLISLSEDSNPTQEVKTIPQNQASVGTGKDSLTMKLTFVLALTLAVSADAADFSLGIGPPAAAIAPGDTGNPAIKKNLTKGGVMAVRPENCPEPAKVQITGTAEGIVDGMRRSMPVTLSPGTVPGAYIVNRDWSPGIWVINLIGVCGTAKAGAVVPTSSNGNFERESSKFYPRAATGAEIEASLKLLAGGKK